jgi:hypothetical protein
MIVCINSIECFIFSLLIVLTLAYDDFDDESLDTTQANDENENISKSALTTDINTNDYVYYSVTPSFERDPSSDICDNSNWMMASSLLFNGLGTRDRITHPLSMRKEATARLASVTRVDDDILWQTLQFCSDVETQQDAWIRWDIS